MTGTGTELVEVPKVLLERVLDRVDDLEAEVSEYRTENERDKATIRQDVHEAIEKAESEAAASSEAESDESAPRDDSMTPMERVIRAGEEGVIGHVTARVERAKTIAQHYSQWAKKAPNGLVIKDGLKTLLETATGERLAWKQVHRAGHALEEFTKGAIRFEKTRRHGWTLIAQPKIVTKLERASSATGG